MRNVTLFLTLIVVASLILGQSGPTYSAPPPSINLSNNAGNSTFPAVQLDSHGYVVVNFHDDTGRPANAYDILKRTSKDRGATFGPIVKVSDTPGLSECTTRTQAGRFLVRAFLDDTSGSRKLMGRTSLDGGTTYNFPDFLDAGVAAPICPSLAREERTAIPFTPYTLKLIDVDSYFNNNGPTDAIGFGRQVGTGNADPAMRTVRRNGGLGPGPVVFPSAANTDSIHTTAAGDRYYIGFNEIPTGGGTYYLRISSSLNDGMSYTLPVNAFTGTTVGAVRVTADGRRLFVTAHAAAGSDLEAYLFRSADGGNSFTSVNVSNDSVNSFVPLMVGSGPLQTLFYVNLTSGQLELIAKRSTNGGMTWGPQMNISMTAGINSIGYHTIQAGSRVHVTWSEATPTTPGQILYRSSPDFGMTWGPIVPITDGTTDVRFPVLAAQGPDVYLAFSQLVSGTNYDIYLTRTTMNKFEGVPFSPRAAPGAAPTEWRISNGTSCVIRTGAGELRQGSRGLCAAPSAARGGRP